MLVNGVVTAISTVLAHSCLRRQGLGRRSRRMFGNAGWLLLRTGCGLVAGVWILSLVTKALGISGYGCYAAIMGVVSVVTTFHGVLRDASQRYLCAAFARDGLEGMASALGSTLVWTLAFVFTAVLLGETAGRHFVGHGLDTGGVAVVTVGRVYQLGLMTVMVSTLRIGLEALVVVDERMAFFFHAGLAELMLEVAAALLAGALGPRALTGFFAALLVKELMMLALYWVRARQCFPGLRWRLPEFWRHFGSMGRFISWNLLSPIGNVLKYQGVCLLLNVHAGVEATAAWKVALHVWGLLAPLASDLSQALAPVVFKGWGAHGEIRGRWVWSTTAVAAVLTLVPAAVLGIGAEPILSAWLGGNLPADGPVFVRWILVAVVFDAVSRPLTTTILATGDVARYQAVSSLISASAFLATLALLGAGAAAWTAVAAVAAVNGLGAAYRVGYVWRLTRNASARRTADARRQGKCRSGG